MLFLYITHKIIYLRILWMIPSNYLAIQIRIGCGLKTVTVAYNLTQLS
jgi:hypothetical protein